MNDDVLAEQAHWDGLRGEGVEINTAGVPPYDVETVADMIVEALRPREFHRWLDLGCGPGRLTRAVARKAPQVEITGVDISKNLLALAKTSKESTGTIRYRECDGRNLPEQCGMFDGVYSVTMFQHIPRIAQAGYILKVADHLHSGGKFLFTVAPGEEDVFLSHQVDMGLLTEWVTSCDMTVFNAFRAHDWMWIEAMKE